MQRAVYLVMILFVAGCAGTINTTSYLNPQDREFKKAYIISTEDSQYIKFRFGSFKPYGYIPPEDGPAEKSEVIGNTDIVIRQELEKYGIQSVIGKKGDIPEDFDLIVAYSDTWRWDFKKVLDRLEIVFISPDGDSLLAKSTYNIYSNKELHNFPTPEKEVPKMIRELLTE